MVRILFTTLIAAALAACAAPEQRDAGPTTMVVFGFTPGMPSGRCILDIGPSGRGRVTATLGPGVATGYQTARVPAGEWDLLRIDCRRFMLDRPVGRIGRSRRAGTFRPLASFTVGDGAPVYLGNIHLRPTGDTGWLRFGIDIDQAAAARYLETRNATGAATLELSPFRHAPSDLAQRVTDKRAPDPVILASGWRLHPIQGSFGGRLSGGPPAVLFPNRTP